jgi:hypothetical protein
MAVAAWGLREPGAADHQEEAIGVKAVVYEGSRDAKVKDTPDAKIEQSTGVLVRITSTPLMQEFSTC